ncbi:hypothetical protein ACFVYR_27355 [Streptomyces sp. NPDC058284]
MPTTEHATPPGTPERVRPVHHDVRPAHHDVRPAHHDVRPVHRRKEHTP